MKLYIIYTLNKEAEFTSHEYSSGVLVTQFFRLKVTLLHVAIHIQCMQVIVHVTSITS